MVGKKSLVEILSYSFLKMVICIFALKNKEQKFFVLILICVFLEEMEIPIILLCKISIKNVMQNCILIVIIIFPIILKFSKVKLSSILVVMIKQIDSQLKL